MLRTSIDRLGLSTGERVRLVPSMEHLPDGATGVVFRFHRRRDRETCVVRFDAWPGTVVACVPTSALEAVDELPPAAA